MASFLEYRAQEWDNRRLWLAVALSLLLHGLIVLLLLVEPWTWRLQPEPPPILAEFVLPQPPKAEAPKAEPSKPQAEAPKPEPAPQTPLPPVPPPSVPQLQRAPVAEESKAPPSSGERARSRPQTNEAAKPAPPQVQRPGPGVATAPQQRPAQAQNQAGNRQPGPGRAAGQPAEAMTQSESDFFLSQIVQVWVIDFDAPQFKNIQIYGRYMVLPNGMLAPPFGKNDPWDMNRMVEGWDQIVHDPRPQVAAFRTALETFLRAMRLAQPMAMPPDAQGYPKVLSLSFKIGDL
jgi:protein TonB